MTDQTAKAHVARQTLMVTEAPDSAQFFVWPRTPTTYTRSTDGVTMVEIAPHCYRSEEFLGLQAAGGIKHQRQAFPALPFAAVAPRYIRPAEPLPYAPLPDPALFEPADIKTRRKWIAVPGGRPLTVQEKRRDLSALISCGRSILDPPPRQGATKASPSRLVGADSCRAQPPLNTRPDKLAVKVVEKIDPVARAVRIEHLGLHGMCASQLWKNTRKPGEMIGVPDAPAPGETEIPIPSRSTFDYQRDDERVQRRPVITEARDGRRHPVMLSDRNTGYRHPPDWASGFWLDLNRQDRGGRKLPSFWPSDRKGVAVGYPLKSPFFDGPDWEGTPLAGTHSDPRRDLGAWARRCRLSRNDERQLWARHLAGDESARQRLINSCASKVLAFAQHRLDQHERWDGFHVLLAEVERIVDARKFDPTRASLPAFVDKVMRWRIKDIKRKIRFYERLMVPTDFTGRVEFDEDTGRITSGAVVRAMAEAVAEAEVDDTDEIEAQAKADLQRLAEVEDESDRLLIELKVDGWTQAEIARLRPHSNKVGNTIWVSIFLTRTTCATASRA